jgi:hypothetical protein
MRDVAEELKRPYPDWTEIAKSFAFGMKMFTRADEAVIRFIADIKELMREYAKLKLKVEQIDRIKEKRAKKEEIERDFERWYQDVLASLNGDKNAKNLVVLLYKFGGIALRNYLCDALKLDFRTVDDIVYRLEGRGIVKSSIIPIKGKVKYTVIYFNHPKYINMPLHEIFDIINSQDSSRSNVEILQRDSTNAYNIEENDNDYSESGDDDLEIEDFDKLVGD